MIKMNEDQERAKAGIKSLIINRQEMCDDELAVIGKPGVGKTTLIVNVVTELKKSRNLITEDEAKEGFVESFTKEDEALLKLDYIIAAPTHKALSVLRTEVNKAYLKYIKDKYDEVADGFSGADFTTIHSLLKLYPRRDGGEEVFARDEDSYHYTDRSNQILMLDEASMVNSELLEYIRDENFGAVIFFGDASQLPPIGEKESPALCIDNVFELTIQHRCRVPDISSLLESIRLAISPEGSVSSISIPDESESVIVCNISNVKSMIKKANNLYGGSVENAMAIAYTNKKVGFYNRMIRRINHYGIDMEEYIAGENAICMSHITEPVHDDNGEKLYDKTLFHTQDQVVIKSVIPSSDGNLEYYDIVITDQNNDVEASISVVKSDYVDYFKRKLNNVAEDAKYYKEEGDYDKSKRYWKVYWNLKDKFKQITPTYSLTSHKSQGSSYDTVYVDVADIVNTCREVDTMLRALYVACSRAREKIVLINVGPLLKKINADKVITSEEVAA